MKIRELQTLIPGRAASDGAGVKLKRSLGGGPTARVDPFLMLDEFRSDDANDYIAGFPPHPHRGFETVTYMLDGRMRHEDHLGNSGLLESGGVQWMTAGRGIIHSEMPEQEDGLMHGFQLWINLPAREKMKPASYRDIPASEIPDISGDGWSGKLVAGEFDGTKGAVHGITTDPLYLDLRMDGNSSADLPVNDERNAFIYVYEGVVNVAAAGGHRDIAAGNAGVFGKGDTLHFEAGDDGARLLVLAARPLNEPIEQYGPFVMNTREEIEQALRDYSAGRLAG
ncbi:MAG: pirin family protein [Gammaproteobacteria bacterium]|nr:pirin family protein [Gammaproteobacteria bacterium]